MQKVLFGIISFIAVLFVYNFFFKQPSFNSGTSAPPIKTQLIDGSKFDLEDLKGNYILLDFWGSWCGPCIREIPNLKQVYNQYHDRQYIDASNFEVVSVALEKSDKYTRKIITDRGLNWPYHIIDVSRIVMLSDLAQAYDVKELPTKFLINPEGKIMRTNPSFEEIAQLLDNRIKK